MCSPRLWIAVVGRKGKQGDFMNAALRRFSVIAIAAILWLPVSANAALVEYDLTFETSGQSIWGFGSSFTMQSTTFLGAQWQDKKAGIDLIVGDEDTNVINPLRIAYDGAFAACRALGFSSTACINGQSARAPVPALGSRPSVRSCGRFDVVCHAKRAVDLTKRAAYDVAFNSCKALGFSSTVCRNGQSARLPVVALGTAPAQYLDVDTRTGVAVEATSDGKVGLELGLAIDSGSVDATVSYKATLDIPDTTNLDKANAINFNAASQLTGANTLNTSFADFELSVDAVMQLSGSVGAEACVIPAGCATGATNFDINERASIVSVNNNDDGEVLILGQTPSDLGIPNANGLPLSVDVAGLAKVTLHLPQPNATGGLDASGDKLTATGQDDLVDLTLDIDNIIATAAGVPGLFGKSFDLPFVPGSSVGFDIINVAMGPTVDLKQNFELDPTLFVTLVFDVPVMINGEIVTSLFSQWDLLPDITFLSDITTVTPTFLLQADLLNETLLDFDLEFSIDLLQVMFDFGLLGDGGFGIGNVLSQGVDLFDSPNLFQSLFALGGWNLQMGSSFIVDFLNGSSTPTTMNVVSLEDEILFVANPTSVPLPGTLVLVASGLAFFGVGAALRRRGRVRLTSGNA